MDINEYKAKIEEYSSKINTFSDVAKKAEHDSIVTKTKLDACLSEIEALDKKSMEQFGVPVSGLEDLMKEKIDSLDKVIARIDEIQNSTQQQIQPASEIPEGDEQCY